MNFASDDPFNHSHICIFYNVLAFEVQTCASKWEIPMMWSVSDAQRVSIGSDLWEVLFRAGYRSKIFDTDTLSSILVPELFFFSIPIS